MIIWIASYPKSGNTWVRSFLTAYYFCEDGIFDIKKLSIIQDYPNKQFFNDEVKEGEIYKHWEESQEKIRDNKKIKFLKTHNSLITAFGKNFTSPKYSLGVIYIVRDPRNVITSIKNHNDFKTYDDALEFIQNDNAILNDYKHLKNFAKTNIINSWRINYQSWLGNNFFRRLTLRYEDMLSDPERTFRDLVIFVNTICRFNDNFDEKKFKNALNSTKFKNLKDLEEKGQFSENVYSVHDKRKIKFFFQGPENDWKKNLDSGLIKKMNEYYKEDLIKFKYKI
ncbi:sulfotransferase domain-containing protein [Candidatus Pelagibacter communis]|uniref:sulfotransferase domain-containing protein n=1 Tax=Candidatus Pelagibacter TaxID=198251 RepID=UPI003EE1B0A5